MEDIKTFTQFKATVEELRALQNPNVGQEVGVAVENLQTLRNFDRSQEIYAALYRLATSLGEASVNDLFYVSPEGLDRKSVV